MPPFPLGAAATLEELDEDPHPLQARLRAREPVSWLPALDGWLVTRRDLALAAMNDAATFTVDDPRFSTQQVIGPSMLTLDGGEHARHRAPFAPPFRLAAVRERFRELIAREADALVRELEPAGEGELRRGFAGPLAAAIITHALGLDGTETSAVLAWYDEIVAAVTEITAGRPLPATGREAFADLAAAVELVLDRRATSSLVAEAAGAGGLTRPEVVSNAAVLLFGGIETTEGMIANALAHLLDHPHELAAARADPGRLPAAVEESLRLEPAAAVVDRYATRDVELAGARIARGDLVRISIAAANRDPAVFPDPDRFDPGRENARLHLAFARGPHVCIGMHLARLEAHSALAAVLAGLGDLRPDPDHPALPRGLVFRKPPALRVRWTPAAGTSHPSAQRRRER